MTAPNSAPISQDPLARLAEQQNWLSPTREASLQQAVGSAIDTAIGEQARRALHGDWLHEPLHAVMSDIPVGSWTAAVTFDAIAALFGSDSLDKAADASVLLGLAGAAATAITGMNDWAEIKPAAPRRIGLVHGILNLSATALFTASAIARAKKKRVSGRVLAGIGLAVVSTAAHLGGNLVYEHRIGVAPPSQQGETTDHMHG